MPRVFYDADADPRALDADTVAIIGYGIQGRPQALTLRDSGIRVVVGNRDDENREQAAQDGFTVVPIAEAVRRATIVFLLVPDEVQPGLYQSDVRQGLTRGNALVFAHGLALRYSLVV